MSRQATPPIKTTTWQTSPFLIKLHQHRGGEVKWLRESHSQLEKTKVLAHPKEVLVSGEFIYVRAEGEVGLCWPLIGALVTGARGWQVIWSRYAEILKEWFMQIWKSCHCWLGLDIDKHFMIGFDLISMLIQYCFICIYIGCSMLPIFFKGKNLSFLAVNYTMIPVS